MKSFHLLAFSGAVVAMLSGLPATVVQAATVTNEPIDTSGVQLEPQQQNGVTYLSGGIGLDESRAILQTKGYNLHMTFSVGSANQYIPDVDVAIQNMQGSSVLKLSQVGPIVYVQLPPGKYLVVTARSGQEKRSDVEVKSGAVRDLQFHWSDSY
ncbi:carboxypeptidase regulatory-like domain-containing protein [Pseudomonas sp. H11T01]|uniref:carboxypeptidase regulatory-like domain-containing protein n=1 Tax=Pseudomonas sp. H11T01 TaxID=3402749 RepID=UPI003AC382BC